MRNISWKDITEGLAFQIEFCQGYSDLYYDLYRWLHQHASDDTSILGKTLHQVVEAAWETRLLNGGLEASLLLPAAIHAAVLADDPAARELRPLYATVGGTYSPENAAALQAGLATLFTAGGEVLPWFLSQARVQTNESSRSVAWLIPAYVFSAWQPDLSITVVDLGTSAGLNLVADQQSWHWRLAGQSYTLGQAPWLIEQQLHVEDINDPGLAEVLKPSLARLNVVGRVGFDRFPLDIYSEEAFLTLEACIWGDQPARLQRLAQAAAGYKQVAESDNPPRLYAGDILKAATLLPKLIPAELATPHLLLVFNSSVTAYMGDTDYQELRNHLMYSFQQLPAGVVGLWLENEPPRYNEQVERPKHFQLRARASFMGGVSSFYLGELEAHPTNLYVRPGWQPLRYMLGW